MPKPKDKNKNPKQIILKEKKPKVFPKSNFTTIFYISFKAKEEEERDIGCDCHEPRHRHLPQHSGIQR